MLATYLENLSSHFQNLWMSWNNHIVCLCDEVYFHSHRKEELQASLHNLLWYYTHNHNHN